MSFLRLMKAGGSRITTSKRSTLLVQLLQGIECIGAQRLERHAVALRRCARRKPAQFRRSPRTARCAAPCCKRRDSPCAHITADVQHAGAGREVAQQALAVGGLVVEPAGLLACAQRRREARGQSRAPQLFGHVAECRLGRMCAAARARARRNRSSRKARRDRAPCAPPPRPAVSAPPCRRWRSGRRRCRRNDPAPGRAGHPIRRTPAGSTARALSRSPQRQRHVQAMLDELCDDRAPADRARRCARR